MTTINMSVERADSCGEFQEIELEITGTHNPYIPARLHCHPDNSSPAEGGDSEIEEVKVLTTLYKSLFVELSSEEDAKAKELLQEAYEDIILEPEFDDDPYYYED